jgi:uncharacterized protein
MESRLFECQVLHARFSPRAHRFKYRIFLFALDLDELDQLHTQLRFFSRGRRNLYSFRDADFLPTDPTGAIPADSGRTLKARVLAHLATHCVPTPPDARVLLITLPRVAGYLFNPVSFYFIHDAAGRPLASIAEVTNTFREVKPFVLGPDCQAPGAPGSAAADVTFRRRGPKHFYVSPFSDVDVAFDFALRVPGEKLHVQIDDYAAGERTLTSLLTGQARPLNDRTLAWFTLKYPLITLRVIALIHWHALRLYLKRVPWFAKSARAADQRDLYRPHASLARPASSPPPPLPPPPLPSELA